MRREEVRRRPVAFGREAIPDRGSKLAGGTGFAGARPGTRGEP